MTGAATGAASDRVVARNAAAMVLQVVLSALVLVATYWLLMQRLTMEEIGLWSLVVGSVTVTRLSEMGLGAGVLRFVAADTAAGQKARAALTVGMAALIVTVLVGLLALVVAVPLGSYLAPLVPGRLHPALEALLPASLLAVVLTAIGNVFLSAIDGCQRMDLRARLMIVNSVIQLAGTWYVLPRWGVAGLGLVQVAQGLFLLLSGVIVTAVLLRRPLIDYLGLDRQRLGELLRFGGASQLAAIAQLLYEPLLKVMLTSFSGLALTGYFDMANRVLLQFRSVVVAAYTALVPHVAARSATGEAERIAIAATYRRAFSILFMVLLPYLTVIAAGLPLALTIWKGHFDPTFLAVALLQCVAIGANMVSVPAYLIYTGVGRLRWNVTSHVLTALLLAGLGGLLGMLFSGPGVLLAGAVALTVGSLLVAVMFQREYGLAGASLFPGHSLAALLLAGLALATSSLIAGGIVGPNTATLWAVPLIFAALAGLLALSDRTARSLLADLVTRFRV